MKLKRCLAAEAQRRDFFVTVICFCPCASVAKKSKIGFEVKEGRATYGKGAKGKKK